MDSDGDFDAFVGDCLKAYWGGTAPARTHSLSMRAARLFAMDYEDVLSMYLQVCIDILGESEEAHEATELRNRRGFLLWFAHIMFEVNPQQHLDCLHRIGMYFLGSHPNFSFVAMRREWRLRKIAPSNPTALTDLYLQLAVAADEAGRRRRPGALLATAASLAEQHDVVGRPGEMAFQLFAYWSAFRGDVLCALTLLEKAEGIEQKDTSLQTRLAWTNAICREGFQRSTEARITLFRLAVRAIMDKEENKDPADRLVEFDLLGHALDRTQWAELAVLSMAATIRIVEETEGHDLNAEDWLILRNNFGNALLRGEWNEPARSVFKRTIQSVSNDWTDCDILYQLAHAHAGVGFAYYNDAKIATGEKSRLLYESADCALTEAVHALRLCGRSSIHAARIWASRGITNIKLGKLEIAHLDFAYALLAGNEIKEFDPGRLESLFEHDTDTPLKYAEALQIIGAKRAATLFAKLAVISVHHASLPDVEYDYSREFVVSRSSTHRTLIELLVSAGRFNEAEQIFDLLRNVNLECFTKRQTPGSIVSDLVALTRIEYEAIRQSGLLSKLQPTVVDSVNREGLATKLAEAFAQLDDTLNTQFSVFQKKAAPEPSDFQRLGAGLSDDTAVLRYISLDNRLLVNMVYRKNSSNWTVDAPREMLSELTFRLRACCRADPISDVQQINTVSMALFEALILPVFEALGHLPRVLYLELDPLLLAVPFAMLFDGTRYLCESTAVVHLHRQRIVQNTRNHTTTERPAPRAAIFGYADEQGTEIPGVAREVIMVHAALSSWAGYREINEFSNHACTSRALLAELGRQRGGKGVIHLASHATFNATNAAISCLVLSDGSLSLRVFCEAEELEDSEVGLFVLSACGTARADLDVEGFSLTLLRNSVRSVVSTLWETIDASAPDFFEAFYGRHFEVDSSRSIAMAIQSAQCKMLEAAKDPFNAWLAHPANWGPYIITTSEIS